MPRNDITIEQLFQELLSQDPSLASQKKEILWLLERMTEHTPSVSIDPLFESRLKDNLRYHMVSQYTPAPQINNWQKFLLYGLPSLAIGLALIYVLPNLPWQSDHTIIIPDTPAPIITTSQPETTNSITNTPPSSGIVKQKEIVIPSQQSVKKEQQNSSQTTAPLTYDAKSSDPIITTEPMMLKTISTPEWWESTTSDTMMIQEDIPSSQKSTALSPTIKQTMYTNDILTLHYSLYRSWEDIQFEGMIDHCKNSYTISEYLVNVSSDATIHSIAKDSNSEQEIKLTITFKDSLITHIKWWDQCK